MSPVLTRLRSSVFICLVIMAAACHEPGIDRDEVIDFDLGSIERMMITSGSSCEVISELRAGTTVDSIFDTTMFGPSGPPKDLSVPNRALGLPKDIRRRLGRTEYIFDAPGGELAIVFDVGDDGYTPFKELWLYPEKKRLVDILPAEIVSKLPTYPGYCFYRFFEEVKGDQLAVSVRDSVVEGIKWRHGDDVSVGESP